MIYSIFSNFHLMNQQALHTFLAILETRNLNHAAERLYVTQSTVSARLNALEQELGQALFHRKKSGAVLTSAGFKFERYARLMTELWRQAKQETALPQTVNYVCNFGCHPDIWSNLGKTFFQKVRDCQPKAALSIWQGEQENLTRWLSTGLVDVALCYSPGVKENWQPQVLDRERLILVSTVKRPLMRWDPVYVYVDYGDDFRRDHAAAYPDGDTPMTVFSSPGWALDYLHRNGGSGYLPERLVCGEIENRRLFVVDKAPEFYRNIYLVSNISITSRWSWFKSLVDGLVSKKS